MKKHERLQILNSNISQKITIYLKKYKIRSNNYLYSHINKPLIHCYITLKLFKRILILVSKTSQKEGNYYYF